MYQECANFSFSMASLSLIPSCQSITALMASEITSFSTLRTSLLLSALILWLDAVFSQTQPHDFMKKLPKDFKGIGMVNSLSLLHCFVCWD